MDYDSEIRMLDGGDRGTVRDGLGRILIEIRGNGVSAAAFVRRSKSRFGDGRGEDVGTPGAMNDTMMAVIAAVRIFVVIRFVVDFTVVR